VETKVWFKGISTDPEIRKLNDKYGIPAEGKIITYEDIAATIGANYQTPRFDVVYQRWVRLLYTRHNVKMLCRLGEGVYAAKPDERVDWSKDELTRGLRKFRRAGRVVRDTDYARLSPEAQKGADFVLKMDGAFRTISATIRKELPRGE